MMIRVKFLNGTTGMVRPHLLNQLIRNKKISEFRRSDGWVVLGRDKIREISREKYQGEERRQVV